MEDLPKTSEDLISRGVVLHRNKRSGGLLLKLKGDIAVKVFPSKGVLFSFVRSLFKLTKAHKQFRSANSLKNIGLKTPNPIGISVFKCSSPYEAAYFYRYKEGVSVLRDVLKSSGDKELIDQLVTDLSIMAENDLLFVDFHLSNVLVDEDRNLWWIDPELKKSRSLLKRRFWSRMERVRVKTDPGVLSEESWAYFESSLREKLPLWLR